MLIHCWEMKVGKIVNTRRSVNRRSVNRGSVNRRSVNRKNVMGFYRNICFVYVGIYHSKCING